MLKYYEHVILRPTYKIYNLFMIAHQIVVGKECLIYQGLAFEFIKLTAKLYITIDKMTRSCRDDEIDKEKTEVQDRMQLRIDQRIVMQGMMISRHTVFVCAGFFQNIIAVGFT